MRQPGPFGWRAVHVCCIDCVAPGWRAHVAPSACTQGPRLDSVGSTEPSPDTCHALSFSTNRDCQVRWCPGHVCGRQGCGGAGGACGILRRVGGGWGRGACCFFSSESLEASRVWLAFAFYGTVHILVSCCGTLCGTLYTYLEISVILRHGGIPGFEQMWVARWYVFRGPCCQRWLFRPTGLQ